MTSDKKSLFIFAGELSGDILGAQLLKALRKHWPNLDVFGVGGPELRAEGVNLVYRMEDFEVMGFSDVLWNLPRLLKQFNGIRDHILKTNPDIVVLIDSPSFTLRMARHLRRRGFKGKIVQYVCPTVWAWGKHRIKELADNFDLLLTIYPFEDQYFKDTKLSVKYVGNPVQERIKLYQYDSNWKQILGIKKTEQLIALFPGSRAGEIRRNLPKQLEAAKRMHRQNSKVSLAISCAHDHNMPIVQEILKKANLQLNDEVFFVPKTYSYDLMRSCRTAIAKSGTVTLELALHECPTVVVFELSRLNRWIAQYILKVKLPHYCIVNILGGKRIYPELIEEGFTPENLHRHLQTLHQEGPERTQCVENCKEIHSALNVENPSEHAAQAIVNVV